MKTFKNLLKRSWLFILALIFLSSCYDIVYVSQDKDAYTHQKIQPKVCVHVSSCYTHSLPYFGVLLPLNWTITDGFDYVREFNGYSMKIGEIYFSESLTKEMFDIDPPPVGYHWWVGSGKISINSSGTFTVRPVIHTGDNTGSYELEYMIGDDLNGLNYLRIANNPIGIIDDLTPGNVLTNQSGQGVTIKWEKPLVIHGISGYNIYRNDVKLNTSPMNVKEYIDENPTTNSFSYEVAASYINGTESERSIPGMICYSPTGPSINFNGDDNMTMVLDAPELNPTTNITIEAWIKFQHGGVSQPYIISKSEIGEGYELYMSNSSSHRFVVFRISPSYLVSNTQLNADVWYHVAATYDGKTMKMYINGELDSEKPASYCINPTDEPLLIGKKSLNSPDMFKGNIDEVRIWEVARTADQIDKYQRLLLSENEKGLIGNWRMDDGCGYYCNDLSVYDNSAFLKGSCWCTSTFPFIPDFKAHSLNITIPVINHYFPEEDLETMTLIYKFNPEFFKFNGLDLYNTQIKKWSVQTQSSSVGYLKIEATTNGTVHTASDVLLNLKFQALQQSSEEVLDFVLAEFNNVKIRTMSGKITVGNVDEQFASHEGFYQKSLEVKDVVSMFPNPVKSTATFSYELEEDAVVDLTIYNLSGQSVATVVSENQNTGAQQAEFDASLLNPGVYMYVLKANDLKFTGKLIVQD